MKKTIELSIPIKITFELGDIETVIAAMKQEALNAAFPLQTVQTDFAPPTDGHNLNDPNCAIQDHFENVTPCRPIDGYDYFPPKGAIQLDRLKRGHLPDLFNLGCAVCKMKHPQVQYEDCRYERTDQLRYMKDAFLSEATRKQYIDKLLLIINAEKPATVDIPNAHLVWRVCPKCNKKRNGKWTDICTKCQEAKDPSILPSMLASPAPLPAPIIPDAVPDVTGTVKNLVEDLRQKYAQKTFNTGDVMGILDCSLAEAKIQLGRLERFNVVESVDRSISHLATWRLK